MKSTAPEPEPRKIIFVAHPFDARGREIVAGLVVPALQLAGFEPAACEYGQEGDLVATLRQRIGRSSGVVALVLNRNVNVFLEVGIALGFDKPCLVLAETRKDAGMLCDHPATMVFGDSVGTPEMLAKRFSAAFREEGVARLPMFSGYA